MYYTNYKIWIQPIQLAKTTEKPWDFCTIFKFISAMLTICMHYIQNTYLLICIILIVSQNKKDSVLPCSRRSLFCTLYAILRSRYKGHGNGLVVFCGSVGRLLRAGSHNLFPGKSYPVNGRAFVKLSHCVNSFRKVRIFVKQIRIGLRVQGQRVK